MHRRPFDRSALRRHAHRSALLAGALLAAACGPALAQSPPAAPRAAQPYPLITVGGEGTVSLKPDLAEASGGVTTEAKTARDASEANAATMSAVIAALKAAGLQDRDIQTAQFTISPVYAPNPNPNRGARPDEPRIAGYRVSNQVRFKIRDLAKVGDVLDRAIAAGATDINTIAFTVADPSPAKDAARADAMADARRRAETLAKAAGVTLGRVVSVTESGANPPRPMPYAASDRMMAQAVSTPVAVGETTLRVGVSVSYELLP